MSGQKKYFLQDTRDMVGNCMLFWRKGSRGYTTRIEEAELFTVEEALSHRKTDRPWPEDLIRGIARLTVDHQHLPDVHYQRTPEALERLAQKYAKPPEDCL